MFSDKANCGREDGGLELLNLKTQHVHPALTYLREFFWTSDVG